jgi:hypothetical protein
MPLDLNTTVLSEKNVNAPSRHSVSIIGKIVSIPNFTTCRLKPFVQKTKSGKLEILNNLDVLVDFEIEPNLVVIKGDGTRISIHKREVGHAICSSPLIEYNFSNVPSAYQKIIRYSSRFIDLIRSKTPKVRTCFIRFCFIHHWQSVV